MCYEKTDKNAPVNILFYFICIIIFNIIQQMKKKYYVATVMHCNHILYV